MAREAVKKTLRLEDDTWAEQSIKVEIALAEFARGALRAAYRLKLHGEGGTTSEWVAKRYIKSVENENKLIEEDIKVQVLSKMYADQYNKHGMPKAVDFVVPFLMSLDGKNYCVEPYISGEYKKHSNNSGFVEVGDMRNTPHAFSHFSLVKSGYRVLICDIQGVNDLYTDPTVHTFGGTEFGDNNLGLRGMALFLYSHTCSPLCQKLGLPAFDLFGSDTPHQNRAPKLAMMRATTMTNSYTEIVSKMKETMAAAPAAGQSANMGPRLLTPPNSFPKRPDIPARIHYELAKMHESGRLAVLDDMYKEEAPADAKPKSAINHTAAAFYHYQRAAIGGHVAAMLRVAAVLCGRNAGADYADVKNPQLGAFYLTAAAARDSRAALLALAEYYAAPAAPDWAKAADFTERLLASVPSAAAAAAADPAAASALTMSKLAVSPLEASVEGDAETWGWPTEFNAYEVQARLAEMFEKGGHGLSADMARAGELYRSAGDEAMAAGKGKLANKYYAQAEVCESS